MEFKLPDIGEGVHEGEIVKWLVKQGDSIAEDQPMVEVMTDKATVEIPSPVTGTVEALFAKEGETVMVGKVILKIAENGKAAAAAAPAPKAAPAPEKKKEDAPAPKMAAAPREEKPEPREAKPAPREVERETTETETLPFEIMATPATRKLARDLNVDLRTISGTGPHGRITKTDVQLFHEGHEAAKPRPSHSNLAVATSTGGMPARQTPTVVRGGQGSTQRIPLRGIRRKIAEAMTRSKHTAAHFLYCEEVDMTEIVKLRKGAAEEAQKRGVKLTFLPFILKPLVTVLKEFPYLNSSLDDEAQEIVLKGDYNIGIATDTPNGLVVPVVKDVDRKNIWELAAEVAELGEKARTGKLTPDDLRGGTFTVTNAGSIGGVFTAPVINHPEVAILGVNSIRKRPMVVNDEIVIRDMMYFSMSVDHRVVDGADAARFMNRLVYFLQEPTRMVFA